MSNDEVMTIDEVAVLRRITERPICATAKASRPPGAVKVGRSWSVLRPKVLAWLDDNSVSPSSQGHHDGGGSA
jgi:hypothetical protein